MFPKIIIVSDHSNKIPIGKAKDSNFSSVFLNFLIPSSAVLESLRCCLEA